MYMHFLQGPVINTSVLQRQTTVGLTTSSHVAPFLLQIQTAGIFLVGCPACNQNFKHFFCTLTCSPDQSLFTNVTSVQNAYDNNRTAVEAIDVFVADSYGQSFYDSCKVDVLQLS